MQFKVGDKVVMTAARDKNCGAYWDEKPYEGIIGVIQEIRIDRAMSGGGKWHGPYHVQHDGDCGSYCLEEEIRHLDAPAIPYDQTRKLPRDKWMPVRQWRRVAR